MKTKIKSYGDEATGFHDKEVPKVGSNHTCLAIISLDSAFKKMKTIVCKCFIRMQIHWKEKLVSKHINDYLRDFSDSGESDEEWISVK